MHAITITIPSTSNVSSVIAPAEFRQRQHTVARVLSALFGGCTLRHASGYYVAQNGDLIEEDVREAMTYADADAVTRHLADLRAEAARWAAEWGQECILLAVDNRPEFVEPRALTATAA